MPQYVTGDEFTRFSDQLSRTLADHHGAIQGSLNRIDSHLEGINGRTRLNSEKISVLEREVEALESVDLSISEKVDDLSKQGCAQYATHTKLLEQLVGLPAWTPQKKAAVAGGLVGTGALIWPALQQIAAAAHALLERLPK
jgi:hypothetical protein